MNKPTSIDWESELSREKIANRFTTGQWAAGEDAQSLLKLDEQARTEFQLMEAKKHAIASSSRVRYKEDEAESDNVDEDSDVDHEDDEYVDDGDDDDDDDENEDLESDENIFHDSDSESERDAKQNAEGSENEKEHDPTAEFEKVTFLVNLILIKFDFSFTPTHLIF